MRDSAAAQAAALEESLRALGNPERAVNEKAYLKSDLEFAGTGLPAVRATVRSWCRDRPALGHDELAARRVSAPGQAQAGPPRRTPRTQP
jgi:hypothetical protein